MYMIVRTRAATDFLSNRLPRQNSTGCAWHVGDNLARAKQCESVWDISSSDGTSRCCVVGAAEVIVRGCDVSNIVRIQTSDGLGHVAEDVALHKYLSAITRIDGRVHVFVVVVVDMASAKSERWATGAKILPVVIGIGNAKVAGVFGSIVITVPHETRLEMIMKVRV